MWSFVAIWAIEELGAKRELPFAFLVGAILAAASGFLGGYLSDRIGRRRVILLAQGIMVGYPILFLAASDTKWAGLALLALRRDDRLGRRLGLAGAWSRTSSPRAARGGVRVRPGGVEPRRRRVGPPVRRPPARPRLVVGALPLRRRPLGPRVADRVPVPAPARRIRAGRAARARVARGDPRRQAGPFSSSSARRSSRGSSTSRTRSSCRSPSSTGSATTRPPGASSSGSTRCSSRCSSSG